MSDRELILTGQGEQQNVPTTLDTSIANDLLGDVQREAAKNAPRVGASIGKYGTGAGAKPIVAKESKAEQKKIQNEQFVGGMSGRVKGMLNSPGFTGDTGMYDTDQIDKRRNIAWIPELYDNTLNRDVEYTQDFTSSVPTIVKDSIKQFWMSLGTLGDKALIGLGGFTSQVSGGEIGTEMRDRAYDTLNARLYNMGLESSEVGDVETLTSKITMGAASMLEMMALGMMTGGVAPLVQMGVDVFGDGTYNNMRKYAEENNGSIEGYEGNWIDIGIDLANAAAQVAIERKLGVGSSRFYRGTGGHFVKEGIEGFLQESSQEFLSDFGEFLKGNEAADIMTQRWQDYLIAGAIGGILQGGLGAATYKVSRAQADANAAQLYVEVVGRANPNISEEQLNRDARAFAKGVNDKMEQDITVNMFDELSERVDANNDRGHIRDSLVSELSKAKAASLGLESVSELDAQDLADIQDAATLLSRESVRMAWANGVAMQDTLMARVYADGNTLKVRELQSKDAGVPLFDYAAERQELANAIDQGRTLARLERENAVILDLAQDTSEKVNRIQQRVELMMRPRVTTNVENQQSLSGIDTGSTAGAGRGRYNSKYQEIILNKNSDISTIVNLFSRQWMNSYFKAARAENAPEGFVKMWTNVEKALGIRPSDKFLDQDISDVFARGFEKYIIDGGKGAPESLKPVYDRLSVRMADIYDDLATRYFDQVANLKPEVQQWFAWNEIFSESLVGAEAKNLEKSAEQTDEKIADLYQRVNLKGEPVSERAKERAEAKHRADTEKKLQGDAKKQTQVLNDEIETAEPAPLKDNSDEPMSSPYTAEGQKERVTSKRIRNMAAAEGILVDARSEYNPYLSRTAAEDAAMMVRMDWEKAKDIAMGRLPPQGGIEAETMFIAVRNQALLNNDAYTLKMLQSSPIQARITEAAQRLSLVRNYTGNGEYNVVKILNDLQKVYDGKIDAKASAEIQEQVRRLSEIIKRFDMDTETAWNNLLSDMECK